MAEEVVSEVTGQVAEVAEKAAEGRMTLDIGNNLLYAILGYLVVFIGLTLLMVVIIIVGKIMVAKLKKALKAPADAPAAAEAPAAKALPAAPGTAGEVKIYDTDPRDAAMIMAIVADKLQKPLNELRFVSIKEVK
jgi:Na+-transporting methylmalonyl-CoA/oxaloacetate decarboxylase gamma subunit